MPNQGKLKGNVIKFPQISVGATEQLVMASILQKEKLFLKIVQLNPK